MTILTAIEISNAEKKMAYQRLTNMEIIDAIRRHFDNQNITQISQATGIDRKTIRKYITAVTACGIDHFDKATIQGILDGLNVQLPGRPGKSADFFSQYKDEISSLINNDKLKAKSAFEVIVKRHNLEGKASYSSFKRFVRRNDLSKSTDTSTCRLEHLVPGAELQIDYCKAGLFYDAIEKRNRTLYAFIGTLTCSRFKYAEFVYSQNQQSFVESHVKMFNHFGGVPKVIVLDNLKSGIIKPDLYEPVINRAYGEMAEYYGCFLNPCRVATPQDKGMVERDVQTIREEFKKLKAIDNNLTLEKANREILLWLKNTYGMRPHGTTGLNPYEEFIAYEKSALIELQTESFSPAFWKQAAVHPDHFIQVQKKSYSVPHPYVGKTVWVKVTHKLVHIYYDDKLIKTHTIPSGARQTDLNDFPENMKAAMDTGVPFMLRKNAMAVCSELEEVIYKVLSPHAYINMRIAFSILNTAKKYPAEIVAEASRTALKAEQRITPSGFSSILEEISRSEENDEPLVLSKETSAFVRGMDYFMNNN